MVATTPEQRQSTQRLRETIVREGGDLIFREATTGEMMIASTKALAD
jgi:hypothetical protein